MLLRLMSARALASQRTVSAGVQTKEPASTASATKARSAMLDSGRPRAPLIARLPRRRRRGPRALAAFAVGSPPRCGNSCRNSTLRLRTAAPVTPTPQPARPTRARTSCGAFLAPRTATATGASTGKSSCASSWRWAASTCRNRSPTCSRPSWPTGVSTPVRASITTPCVCSWTTRTASTPATASSVMRWRRCGSKPTRHADSVRRLWCRRPKLCDRTWWRCARVLRSTRSA
mmetsp:Transcript_101104/g.291012  ORF Transcript_101104/g.291012 Transcript_101104/m.291012 type:complete len:232 (+) Transcript_101104:318-1013(+)